MTLSRLYFLLGVAVTCLSVALMAPKIVGKPIVHQRDVIKTDTLYVDKSTPNFQLESHQIKSSLNKSKLKHLLIYIHALCVEYNVDYNLVKAVIATESSWNHKARSTSDARGLMQVKPQTAFAEFKTPGGDLYDPYVNVTLGIMYLSRLTQHYKMKTQAELLTAYSHGPTATKGYSEKYKTGNFYVASVLGKIN
tara:strand:- start:554 stop:1135 length:582 start_codon:yes stop_codon:yes gene_type:complete